MNNRKSGQNSSSLPSKGESEVTMTYAAKAGKDSKGLPPEIDTEVTRLSAERLDRLTKEELIGLVLDLRKRQGKTTDRLVLPPAHAPSPVQEPGQFPSLAGQLKDDAGLERDEEDYVRLPAITDRDDAALARQSWRIRLVPPHPELPPLRLRIRDSVFIGRKWDVTSPDLDLTHFAAGSLGVSRRHALLRPTEDSLDLIDLDSTNGTYVNGQKLEVGVDYPLKDSDAIGFGWLTFTVRIDGKPGS